MNKAIIGVDISKAYLDAHRLPDGAVRRFGNDKTGQQVLIRWLDSARVERIVYKATGPYARAFGRGLGVAPACHLPMSTHGRRGALLKPSAHAPTCRCGHARPHGRSPAAGGACACQ